MPPGLTLDAGCMIGDPGRPLERFTQTYYTTAESLLDFRPLSTQYALTTYILTIEENGTPRLWISTTHFLPC